MAYGIEPGVAARIGGGGRIIEETTPTLRSNMGDNQLAVAYGIDQQGGKGNASYTVNVAPTILSDSHGTPHGVAYEKND